MTYIPRDTVPIHDTSPSETEPPESHPLPCGCDPDAGESCAVCYRLPVVEPVHVEPVFAEREQPEEVEPISILSEALGYVSHDRQNDYGTPEENWGRISRIASAMCEMDLSPEVCVKVLLATKLARMITSPHKRDNYVDLAGYSHVLWRVMEAK